MKLIMIATSNIKKNKSMTFTLITLILFTTVLLYIGSSVIIDMNYFLDEKNQKLNGSDFIVLTPYVFEQKAHKIIDELGGCEDYESNKAIMFSGAIQNTSQKEERQFIGCFMLNGDTKERIATLNILDKGEKKLKNSIVLPYYLKVSKGYQTGDQIKIINGDKERDYVIYGFSEDIMFAIPSNLPYYKCYVYEDEFNQLFEDYKTFQTTLVKTKLSDDIDVTTFGEDFVKRANNEMKEGIANTMALDYVLMKEGVSVFLSILMSILIVFSFIILLIALTVVRFAIVTHIEGNMKNIGAMEALGYTAKELIRATMLQFFLISMLGIALGLILAMFGVGMITNFVSTSIGLTWKANFNGLAVLINFVVILALVLAITYITSQKLNKISPLIALREGINTHSFRKNFLPLEKSPFLVNISLGLKSLLHNSKQNIIIVIIVTLMSFVSVFAFTVNYNFNVDNTAFLRLIGLEKCQLMINYYGEDAIQVFDEIGNMSHVKKTIQRTTIDMTVRFEGKEVSPNITISNDYKNQEINTIVKGRYPIHDNEIALTALILRRLNANLGDVVNLGGEGLDHEFLVVGVTQHINNLGKGGSITEEGMFRINPDFIPSGLYVYLEDNKNIDMVTKEITSKFGKQSPDISNQEELYVSILGSFNRAVVILCGACILITLSIITLILYLLIKIKVMKERVKLGVSKALGYTTGQLIIQMIVSFSPVCILGAFLGTILAGYLINPFFVIMLMSAGIQNSHFIIIPWLMVVIFLGISVFSMMVAAFVARGIKKITPRELFL